MPSNIEERIEGGVSLLGWIAVYTVAVGVLLLDMLVWRPW